MDNLCEEYENEIIPAFLDQHVVLQQEEDDESVVLSLIHESSGCVTHT